MLLLHGWGVGPQAYAGAVRHLTEMGCTVAAPAQPGFGGTPALSPDECSFAGYARWAAEYLEAHGAREPATVVGHSFGGGVALQLAHDFPDLVRSVVLCNPVGGGATPDQPPTGDRPVWTWGRDIGADLFALSVVMRVVPAVLTGVLPNLVQNPMALWRVADVARRADLLDQAAALAARGVPLTVVWSDRDRLVPYGAFDALCRAAGVRGEIVPGSHSWLIGDPGRFADVVLRAMVHTDTEPSSRAAPPSPVGATA